MTERQHETAAPISMPVELTAYRTEDDKQYVTYVMKPENGNCCNTCSVFSEITQLEFGECPPGAINITLPLGLTSPVYWCERSRYIVYEEQYDDVNKKFDPPQYTAINYKHFVGLCRVFKTDLRVITSNADSAEMVMDEIVNHMVSDKSVQNDGNARQLRSLLLAQRWHPQVNKSYFSRRSVIPEYERKQSIISLKTSSEMVNKYLSACLPEDAGACCIMTGCMPCLTRSCFYLVRLNGGAQMPGLVEVDAPLRFIVLALSHLQEEQTFYFHLSRCFATLMQHEKFCRAAYRAADGSQLFQAAYRFSKGMMILSSHPAIAASGGIPVSPRRNSVNFERTDLVFEDYAADYAASIKQKSVDEDKEEMPPQPRCSPSFCRRLCPPFKELIMGIRVLAARMPSDYVDAFTKANVGTMLSSILFIYFVVFGPAITFGNLMLTEVNPGFTISLNIFAAGISTLIYSLFAGQPLGSVGPSGPGFIFETIIAAFARSTGADFFILRFWVGIYTAVFGVILISLNLSSMASYARRSLEELFSSFICLFLILKAIFSMFKAIPQNFAIENTANSSLGDLQNALNTSQNASRAAVSLFLALLMLIFSLCVNSFKRSHFIRRTFRYWVGAFNVPLGIVFVTLIERAFFADYKVKTLDIPAVSDLNVSMLVQIVDLKQAVTFTYPSVAIVHSNAVFLGFFTALLVFTETALNSVTALKPKAVKPSPFVMDHVITVVVFPLLSAFLGWPFMSGVPVRTIANTMALVKVDPHPPPGKPAEIISLVEQRVSVLIVGILVSISIVLGDILRFIPIAVLYGMFIYLGLSGLRGLDSVSSLLALLTRRKYWTRWEFLTNLPKPQLAVFTFINFFQLSILIVCIVLAEFTSASYVTLITPFVLIGCGLIREFLLPRWRWLAPSLEKLDKRCLPAAGTFMDPTSSTFEEESGSSEKVDKQLNHESVETLLF